jgi:hypothetical protein
MAHKKYNTGNSKKLLMLVPAFVATKTDVAGNPSTNRDSRRDLLSLYLIGD